MDTLMQESAILIPPPLLRRLAAMLYDTLLVIPFIGVTIAAATAVEMWLLNASDADYYQMHPQLVQALSIACVIVFFTGFWRKGGQTLGMQAWRVKLVDDATGEVPGTSRCVLRCLAALVSLAPAGLGYWWCLVDKRKRYWHDHLSGTHLVLLPKPAKG
jgi:uncharacterized RDD family membrane protein YckC